MSGRRSEARATVLRRLAALGLVAALGAVIALSLASYRGGVGGAVAITVDSSRSGLVLEPGAMVKMHGVQVGTVTTVAHHGAGARLELRLDADSARLIPQDVAAEIRSTTVFGAKFVRLSAPTPATPAQPIAAGTVIPTDRVTVEINTIFESLTTVLSAVEPQKLNATLTALAQGLQGRGDALGESVENINVFLAELNRRLPTLEHDITAAADLAVVYADAAPDLLATLAHLTPTARTIAERDAELRATLLGAISMSDAGQALLAENADDIDAALATLRPTAALLGQYSGGITCFLMGVDETRKLAEPVSGGNGATMLLNSTLLLGVEPYTTPENLPVVQASGGPRCGALPKLTIADVPAPYLVADTGANPFGLGQTAPQLRPDSLLRVLPFPPAVQGPR
ncbi:MCE family protein [Tomitella biformata]|uniref:MCE family protein n=1 Tax=Tomitella biformata TaxID=630403 RepID=UPI0004662E7B|nr:MCE family protein [Tomitella biformata]